MKKKDNLKKILRYFKQYKRGLIISSIGVTISNCAYIFTGYLNGAAIESVVKMNLLLAVMFLGSYIVISLISEIVSRRSYHVLSMIQVKVARQLGYETYVKMMKLPAYAFEEQTSGKIINRITNDTETVVGSIDQMISIISTCLSAFIILIYIAFNSWHIALVIVLFLIGYFFVVRHFTKILERQHKERKTIEDGMVAITTETVRGIREVWTLGIKGHLEKEAKSLTKELYEKTEKEYVTGRNYDLISATLKIILEGTSFMLCVFLVYYEQLSITFFVAMTYYIYRYTWLIEIMTRFSSTYQSLNVAITRIGEILNNDLYQDVLYGNKVLDECHGVVEFKNVTFGYKNEGVSLNNFNILFEPNKKIAIVGASGGGKTTIFNLITRLFDSDKGTITLDGVDIKELSEEELRKDIAIIRQDPFIFNKTIKENFKMIDEKITLKDIEKYCKMANIDEYFKSLPKKYDTLIGEGGVNLSGGQKQRLAIARTLMKNARVILFDEATSALDNESQQAIKKSIDGLVKDHTIIIIAHRLSTIIDADLIYVVKNGKVIDSGTHEELFSKNKYYQKLYTSEEISK